MALAGSGGSGSSRTPTAAQTILNRPNVREDRTVSTNRPPSAIYTPPQNANQREGRTAVGGVGSVAAPPPPRAVGTARTNTDQNTTPRDEGNPYIPPMPPPPPPPPPVPPSAKDLGVVKNPSRDVTDIASLVPQADASTVSRLLFEQFSAVELSQVLTPRTIDGIDQQYSIISNLSDIRRRYNSTKELTIMDKLAPISGVFGIDLNSKIPGESYIINNNLNTTYSYLDENNQKIDVEKGYIYIDTNGDLIIEFDNMADDELIQVQIDSNGTIYEVTQ